MWTVKQLFDFGLEKKREGNFLEAIKIYNQVKELDPNEPSIYMALGKIYYLNNQREESMENYLLALQLNMFHFASRNGIKGYEIESIKVDLLQQFFNTNIHLAHAYFDLDREAKDHFALMLSNGSLTGSRYSIVDAKEILEYEISLYRYGLAGGGIKNEPKEINVTYNINFNELYKILGERVAMEYFNWAWLKTLLD